MKRGGGKMTKDSIQYMWELNPLPFTDLMMEVNPGIK
jgi:hypothetical protein